MSSPGTNGSRPHEEGGSEQIHTQTADLLSVAEARPKSERFAAVPYRVVSALADGELDELDLLIIVWITAHCTPPRRKYARPLAAFTRELNCGKSPDTISRRVDRLSGLGWIGYKKPPQGANGRGASWLFWLTGADLLPEGSAHLPHTFRTDTPHFAEPFPDVRNFEGAQTLSECANGRVHIPDVRKLQDRDTEEHIADEHLNKTPMATSYIASVGFSHSGSANESGEGEDGAGATVSPSDLLDHRKALERARLAQDR